MSAPDEDIMLTLNNARNAVMAAQSTLLNTTAKVGMTPGNNNSYISANLQNELYNAIDRLCEAHAKHEVYKILSTSDFYHMMMISAGAEAQLK